MSALAPRAMRMEEMGMGRGSITVGLCQISESFGSQNYLPLSVGLLQAYVLRHAPDPRRYRFLAPVYRRSSLDGMTTMLQEADIAAFSVYVWNQNISLELARRLKARNPGVLIVMGGPQIPHNAEAFLREHPWVDVVCHGEGEAIFLDVLERYPAREWSGLEGVSFLAEGRYVQGNHRPRMTDLAQVPSPYLAGVFDGLVAAERDTEWLGLWETNRGCPFSCTFCEWGDKAFNRLCHFDLDRLRAELEWFARHRVEFIFCCDSNFGLADRDLQIAEMVVETKKRHGYPRAFSVQSAKNATERIYAIQKLLSDQGLSKGVLLALQSVNPATLDHVKRRNISLDTFDQLQRRFKQDGIATFTDLIIGLPGETYESFVEGVSTIISKGQHNRIQFINLSILGNAEMAEPEYRRRFGLEVVRSRIINIHGSRGADGDGIEEMQDLVIATASMPRPDWVRTRVFSWMTALIHFDKLLQVPLVVLHERTGIAYRDLLEAFVALDRRQYPVLGEIVTFFEKRAGEIQDGGPEYYQAPEWLGIWWPDDEYTMIRLCAGGQLAAFYEEAERLLQEVLKKRGLACEPELLHACTELNRCLIRMPFQTQDLDLLCSHNVWEIYQSGLLGQPVTVSDQCHAYRVDRHSETWDSWEDWCRRVIWYGNKKGAYLYRLAPGAGPAGSGT